MTTATRLTGADVLLLLSERLENYLASLKTSQEKQKKRTELELVNLKRFLKYSNEELESRIQVCKLNRTSIGTLGECIDTAGNFWVTWSDQEVPKPELIVNLVPVSLEPTLGLQVGQTINLQGSKAIVQFFAGEDAVLQVGDVLQAVKISQLVEKTSIKSAPSKPGRDKPLCPEVLVISERESYYLLPPVSKAPVFYSTENTVRVELQESPKNLSKDQVYCLCKSSDWSDFLVLYEALQKALQGLASSLLELGRYDLKLADRGGYKKAPNPLAPYLILAPDPESPDAYYLTNWSLPYANLEMIERHTPQMVKFQGKRGFAAQRQGFCCPTEMHFSQVEALYKEAENCAHTLESFLRDNLRTYAATEKNPPVETSQSLKETSSQQELEQAVWDIVVHYLSDVIDTDEKEVQAIILTCETNTTLHIEAITTHFPVQQRESIEYIIRSCFKELYEADSIASRLLQMPKFSVGDKVRAIQGCELTEGTIKEVCNHVLRLEESPNFFLADYFELMPNAVVKDEVTSTQPGITKSTEMWLNPNQVITTAGTQSRDPRSWGQQEEGVVSLKVVEKYAQLMREGLWDVFQKPLPVIYFDAVENKYYASDSHHRTESAKLAGIELVYEVRPGELCDAIANSCRSNRNHSLLVFTDDDQRRQIELFLDILETTSPEQRERLLKEVPGLSNRERTWSCRVIAKYLNLSEAGYRTVNNIVNERKQKQLVAEFKVGERVQLSLDQRKIKNFKFLAFQVAGCAARIVDKDADRRLVKVLPEGLPETDGFSRWVVADAVTLLTNDVQPFAKLLPDWQKFLIIQFCEQTYGNLFNRADYIEGSEVDGSWIATVRIEGVPLKVVLDYNTSFFSVEITEEQVSQSDDSAEGQPAEDEQNSQDETEEQEVDAADKLAEDKVEKDLDELFCEDASLVRAIANSFEVLDFEFFDQAESWLEQASTSTLERIAAGAEQLALKAKAALTSR